MKYVVYEQVGTITEPSPTPYTTTHYRAFYNLHRYLDCEGEPRSGARNIGRFGDAEAALAHMWALRDRQERTGTPAFGEGSYLGMIHRVESLHDAAVKTTYPDLRPTGHTINAVSFGHARSKARVLCPDVEHVVVRSI